MAKDPVFIHDVHLHHSVTNRISTSYLSIYLSIYGCTALCWALAASSVSWYFTQWRGLLGRGISRSQGRYQHRTIQTQNKRTQSSIPRVGFEPTAPVFEWAKMVNALDRTATVIGTIRIFIHSSMALQPFAGPWSLLQFCDLFYTDGRTPRTSDQPVARPLPTHRTTQT
jgi:hypothetical protein